MGIHVPLVAWIAGSCVEFSLDHWRIMAMLRRMVTVGMDMVTVMNMAMWPKSKSLLSCKKWTTASSNVAMLLKRSVRVQCFLQLRSRHDSRVNSMALVREGELPLDETAGGRAGMVCRIWLRLILLLTEDRAAKRTLWEHRATVFPWSLLFCLQNFYCRPCSILLFKHPV